MKRALAIVLGGWGVGAVPMVLGGRAIWFGTTPGTGVADVVASAASGVALILVGLAIGLAANGIASATRPGSGT